MTCVDQKLLGKVGRDESSNLQQLLGTESHGRGSQASVQGCLASIQALDCLVVSAPIIIVGKFYNAMSTIVAQYRHFNNFAKHNAIVLG